MELVAWCRPGAGPRHDTRSVAASFGRTSHTPASVAASCDDAADAHPLVTRATRDRRCRPRRLAGPRRRRTGVGARSRAGGAAEPGLAALRLDDRAARGDRDRRRAGLVALGRPEGRRRASIEPGAPPPHGRDRRGDGRDRVRADVGDRALRHDPVLDPHAPAHPADARGRAAHRPRGAGDADPAGLLVRDEASLGPTGPAFARGPIPRAPAGRVTGIRSRPLVGAFHAAVRRGARGSAAPQRRARAVPRERAPVLVAGRGPRSRAIPDVASSADRVPVHADDHEHVHGDGHPQRRRRPLSALRDRHPAVGAQSTRGPEARRRVHVDRRRPHLHRGDPRGRGGLDRQRRARRVTDRPPGPRGSLPRSGSGSGVWPSGWPTSAGSRARPEGPGPRRPGYTPGIGAAR